MSVAGPVQASTLAAVLFDLDGTLVDTEPYWFEAEYALVEGFGGSWSDAHARALIGSALLDSAAYIREHGGVDLELPAIVERMTEHVVRAVERAVPWRPGAVELLADLVRAGVPCALVTMSYERLARAVLAQLPAGRFDAVVTGDQVRRGKPDPEPYRTAAQRLGVDPARCVAIEDSATGIVSAEAAGCVVVGVPHNVAIPQAPRRTLVSSLRELTVSDLQALVCGGLAQRPT